MITAKEAKQKLMRNPTFERKLELFNEVSAIIDQAVAEGSKSFNVTEEQHLALNKELLSKGYTQPQIQIFIAGMFIGGSTHPYTYNI